MNPKPSPPRCVLPAIAAALVLLACTASPALATYGRFADCVKRSGAVFYSAFWCPHCQEQLKSFRGYANRLKWVECYPGQSREAQALICKKKGIKSYPTWILGDGTVRAQFLQHDELARLTGCPKP